MILPDVNLLIHAYNADSPRHDAALAWFEGAMNGREPVGLPWAVLLAFLRLTTNRHVLAAPLTAGAACNIVRSWLEHPNVRVLHPGDRHAEILFGLLETLGAASNLTTDAHLAALAIEHQAELYSTDADFGRFSGLRWRNPVS